MVLGVPRSGTSCVAGVLWMLGVDMGSGHLQTADQHNPLGYFEDVRWQALNKQITGLRYGTNEPAVISERQKAQDGDRQPQEGRINSQHYEAQPDELPGRAQDDVWAGM
jgi:hypothetical protein